MNRQFCKYAAHIYVLSTVLGLLLFPVQGVSNFFLAIGANSIYIALGVALLSPLSAPGSIGCLIWSFVFFAALIVTYVMAIKKLYLPLLILSILDLVPVVLFGIYTFAKGNMYGLKLAILDIVVSIIVVSLFSVCFFIRKNQELRKIADEAVS